MRFKKTFFALASIVICVAPILGSVFFLSSSNQNFANENNVSTFNSTKNIATLQTGRPTTVKNRIIVPSQNANFAQNYLDWGYFNNLSTTNSEKLKQLLFDNAFESLPSSTTKDDIDIKNGYIDNYTGTIVVNFDLKKYYDNSGNLAPNANVTNVLNDNITISGFRTSSLTIIPDQIITNISANIDTINETQLSPLVQNHLINGIPSSTITLANNSLIRYPGLKKITSNISVDRYLVDAYVNEETFATSLQPMDGYTKIGYYASKTSPLNGTTSPLEKNDVSFYGDFTSNGLTTYINEGNFIVPNQYLNNTASEIHAWDNDKIISDILDQLQILINPFVANNASKITISNKSFNDLTGTLSLETKLTNNVYYKGQTLNYSTPNQDGSNRSFFINITGFSTVKETSVISSINITNVSVNNSILSDRQASEFVDIAFNQTLLIDTFKQLQKDGITAAFAGIPTTLPPPNTEWFSNQNISFDSYNRSGNGLSYVGIPNNITGELKVTINVNWYFDPNNGALITNGTNPLKLTTTLFGFRRTNDNFAKINPRVAMRDVETILPQNAFEAHSTQFYQDYLLDPTNNAISNFSNLHASAEIQITEQDKIASWQDSESTNRTGNFMLHYQYRNFIDPNDGILNSNYTPGEILLGNFLNVLPTSLNESVSLEFFSLTNAPFVTDVTNAGDQAMALKKLEELLVRPRPGREDLPNIANLFRSNNSNNSIPRMISNWYSDPNSSPNVQFSDFFEITSIIDSDVKNGTLTAEIRLKTFYENNNKASLVINGGANSNQYITSQITFLGFTPARPTDVNYLINIRNASNVNDFNHYPSDLSKDPTILKNIIDNNKILFFRNIPENFGVNNFDISNIVSNNTDGSITFSITIKNNYFDDNSIFQANGPSKTFNNIGINGFLTALPTESNSLVNISSLFYDNSPLNEGLQLEVFEKMAIAGQPTGDFVNNISYLIKNNPNSFLINPYDIDKITTDSQYFSVSSPVANYGTGRLSFVLNLNYYFDDDAVPISPAAPATNPKTYNISLTGFANNRATSAVSRFSLEQYPNINQYTPRFLVSNPDILKEYIFGNHAKKIAPNFPIIGLLFRDLPIKWTLETDNVINNQYYTEANASIISIAPLSTQGSITVEFQLQNIFVLANNNLEIGSANFSVIFDGLNKITATEIDDTWDLNSLTTNWGSGNAPSEQKISTMTIQQIETWLASNIFGNTNTLQRYTNFITNLVTDNTPSVVSYVSPIKTINAKTGTIVVDVSVTNYYNADGTINNGTKTQEVNINGFATENSTFVRTRATSINPNPKSSSNILFGDEMKLPSEFIANTTNASEILKTNINNTVNNSTSDNIMSLLFSNIVVDTKISTIVITGFDDLAGTISFKASIENYYDGNGVLIKNTPSSEFPNEFTINGLYAANPTNITHNSVFINDLSSLGLFGPTGNLSHLSPNEFLNNYNNQLVQNTTEFERAIAVGYTTLGKTNYPFVIPSNATFINPQGDIINNNQFGGLGAVTAKINTNSYSINEKEGILNFSVTYANVWTEENKTIAVNGATNTISGRSLKVVTDGGDKITTELSITGFQQSNVLDNSLIIASIVTGSVGLIIIFAIAIYFLVTKIRTYKG